MTAPPKEPDPMTEAPARPLLGFTVAITAARRADELATLLERRGAALLAAPRRSSTVA